MQAGQRGPDRVLVYLHGSKEAHAQGQHSGFFDAGTIRMCFEAGTVCVCFDAGAVCMCFDAGTACMHCTLCGVSAHSLSALLLGCAWVVSLGVVGTGNANSIIMLAEFWLAGRIVYSVGVCAPVRGGFLASSWCQTAVGTSPLMFIYWVAEFHGAAQLKRHSVCHGQASCSVPRSAHSCQPLQGAADCCFTPHNVRQVPIRTAW